MHDRNDDGEQASDGCSIHWPITSMYNEENEPTTQIGPTHMDGLPARTYAHTRARIHMHGRLPLVNRTYHDSPLRDHIRI